MSLIRFNHVFAFLMLLSLVSAFVIPQRVTDKAAAHFRTFFAPVAWPLHRFASSIHYRMTDPYEGDERPEIDVRAENALLRTELARMAKQLDDLQALNADRELLGSLRPFARPLAVVGTDGNRDALILRPLLQTRLAEDMPVIYPFGLVGRLDRTGAGASPKVRLITDTGFRLTAGFRRFVETPDGPQVQVLSSPPQLVEGRGNGRMIIRNVTDRQADDSGVRKGDWVVLDDRDWSSDLQGLRIGQITSVGPRPDAPHFVLIELEPMHNLKMLREVMVFDRTFNQETPR